MKNAFHNITGFICFIKKSLILFLFVVFFLVVFIFFVNNKCFSQNIDSEDVFYINKIPPQGIVLDKGWKFNTGDNSEWANPEFDDKSWQSINPTLDIHDLLLQIPESGICWFRLHLSVDIPLNIQLVMMIQQTGASEIYLNGKLIHTFGVLSTDPDKIQAFNPLDKPVSFSANNFSQQVLVVRYALQPNISYSSHWANKNIGLKILLNTTENAIDQYKQIHTSRDKNNIFKIGMFVILGILYSAFYLFYPKQKVILYFSLYAFLNVCIWTLFMYINNLNEIDLWFRINNLLLVMQVAGDLIMLLAIYLVLEQKTGWI